MNRLTHERSNGIKSGYWSPEKKQELVQALAAYENTGLSPDQIREMDKLYREKCRETAELQRKNRWIPVEEELPQDESYVLMSFENFSNPLIGRYEVDDDGGGAFYVGDDDESCDSRDLFVNAWMPLPERYREEED